MNRLTVFVLAALCALPLAAESPESFDAANEEAHLQSLLAPPVKSLRVTSPGFYALADRSRVTVRCAGAEPEDAARLVRTQARAWWGATIDVTAATNAVTRTPEGYRITATADALAIDAATMQGVNYALLTLRQLMEPVREGVKTAGRWTLPTLEIEDEPATAFRAIHVCIFPKPETTFKEAERLIRLAAYYKFNHVLIEASGSLVYPSHPEYTMHDKGFSAREMRRLVKLAKSLGLTPVPVFQIWGHAACSGAYMHKHAMLDRHPEYAPLFEPVGSAWCLSNPDVRPYLEDFLRDLADIFENPPYFHLGCDEAGGAGICSKCRRADYTKLLEGHLLHFGAFVKSLGARPMVWHDMFVHKYKAGYDGCVMNGTDASVAMIDRLPKDFIVCDWKYWESEKEKKAGKTEWGSLRHFIEKGFDAVGCTWENPFNTIICGKAVRDLKAFGYMATTWNTTRGRSLYNIYYNSAVAAWNPDSKAGELAPRNETYFTPHDYFAAHLRDVHHDMGVTEYIDFGSSPYQFNSPFESYE